MFKRRIFLTKKSVVLEMLWLISKLTRATVSIFMLVVARESNVRLDWLTDWLPILTMKGLPTRGTFLPSSLQTIIIRLAVVRPLTSFLETDFQNKTRLSSQVMAYGNGIIILMKSQNYHFRLFQTLKRTNQILNKTLLKDCVELDHARSLTRPSWLEKSFLSVYRIYSIKIILSHVCWTWCWPRFVISWYQTPYGIK